MIFVPPSEKAFRIIRIENSMNIEFQINISLVFSKEKSFDKFHLAVYFTGSYSLV